MSLTKVSFSMIQGEVVNVLDYGATGDGVTNDTAAYLAAIATGKNVYFPQGTYLVAPVTSGSPARASAAVLSTNQVIFGDGARSVIQWNTGVAATRQTLMMITAGSNITIRDLRFTNAILAVQITATADGGVENVKFQNLVIDNMDIGLGIGEQIALNPSGSKFIKNVTVENCKFDTVAVHGVLITNIYGFIVDGCYFNNSGFRATSGGFCVDMSQGSRYGVLTNCIAENSRYFCKTESFEVAPATAANCLSQHIVISNNLVRNMVPQTSVTTDAAILLNYGASNISVVNNIISYPNTGSCLRVFDGNSVAIGPTIISNNQFQTAYYGALITMNAAGLNTQVLISENTFFNSVGCSVRHTNTEIKNNSIEPSIAGIEFTATCSGLSITGNKIVSGTYGILFSAIVSDVLINANKITSTASPIYSELFASSNVIVSDNYLRGAIGGYLASTSGLVMQGNSVTTTGTANFPSMLVTGATNATISENTINTNTGNPNVSLKVEGVLTNVLVENNRTSRTVSVGAGTNVVTANNAFALGYTA
jgi:hypothetical protein